MSYLPLEKFADGKPSLDDALLWLSINYPKGIKRDALVELNKKLEISIPSEYASIYRSTILDLGTYLKILKRTAKNHSLYTYGAIIICLNKLVHLSYAQVARISYEDATSGTLFGYSVPFWLQEIIEEQKQLCPPSHFLFTRTKTGRYRYVTQDEAFYLNRAMSTKYMGLREYGNSVHLWGRDVGVFNYVYGNPYIKNTLVGEQALLFDGSKKMLVDVLSVDGNVATIEIDGQIHNVSKYLLFAVGNRYALENV